MVGLAGFEPAASSSRTKRATRLRYSPFLTTGIYSGWLVTRQVEILRHNLHVLNRMIAP